MKAYFADILEISLPMSVLIAILLLLSPFIKKSYASKWRYYMWLFAAVRLIFPFKIPVWDKPVTIEIPQRLAKIPVTANTSALIPASSGISLQTILTVIYFAGVLIFATYQLLSYMSFKKRIRRWYAPVKDEATLALFYDMKEGIIGNRKLDFMQCKIISTPMVFGLIKPVLLLPDYPYTERELAIILRHELLHIKRNDILYKLILMTANCLNWFNPLVYMMVSAANNDIELSCDCEVVKDADMDYRRDYCRTILTVIHSKKSISAPLSTCFTISRSAIKERLGGILDLRQKRKGIALFAVVAVSIALSGSMITFAAQKTAQVLEEDLRIIERPTPKPDITPIPLTPSPAPTASSATKRANTYSTVEITPTPTEYVPEPTAVPDATASPQVKEDSGKINLSDSSNMMNIYFNEEGEAFTSSSSFTADENTDMMLVGNGACTVQVVDNATGEIVSEFDMTDEENSLTVPMNGGEYSITAIPNKNSERHASIYVYGK